VTSPAGSVETHGNPMETPWKTDKIKWFSDYDLFMISYWYWKPYNWHLWITGYADKEQTYNYLLTTWGYRFKTTIEWMEIGPVWGWSGVFSNNWNLIGDFKSLLFCNAPSCTYDAIKPWDTHNYPRNI
jgi:hypothetical protein